MKKFAILFAGLFLMTFAFQSVNAQQSDAASAVTSANILKVISIDKTDDLKFGNIIGTSAGGTVTISPAGGRSSSAPDLISANAMAGTFSAASFDVTGDNNATYSVVVTNPTFNVTNTNGQTMSVGSILTNLGESPTTGALDGSGNQTITVGATLTVAENQEPGLYQNENALEITVAYN